MKDYTVAFKAIFLLSMLSIGMFASCSDDEKEAPGRHGSSQRVVRIHLSYHQDRHLGHIIRPPFHMILDFIADFLQK